MPVPASDLTLFSDRACPFCRRVLFAMNNLGLEIEERDVFKDPSARTELLAARGRGTVPVLRIRNDDGTFEWMPESADIVRFLTNDVA